MAGWSSTPDPIAPEWYDPTASYLPAQHRDIINQNLWALAPSLYDAGDQSFLNYREGVKNFNARYGTDTAVPDIIKYLSVGDDPQSQFIASMARQLGSNLGLASTTPFHGSVDSLRGTGRDKIRQFAIDYNNGAAPAFNWSNASDEELTNLYQAAGGSATSFGGAYDALMSDRVSGRSSADTAYRSTLLGGGYEGGVLPKTGYAETQPTFGSLGWGGFSTGAQNSSQPTGYGFPGSNAFQGWGGPTQQPQQQSAGWPSFKNPFGPL